MGCMDTWLLPKVYYFSCCLISFSCVVGRSSLSLESELALLGLDDGVVSVRSSIILWFSRLQSHLSCQVDGLAGWSSENRDMMGWALYTTCDGVGAGYGNGDGDHEGV